MSATKTDFRVSLDSEETMPRIEPVKHFTIAERVARGKAARGEVPRVANDDPLFMRPDRSANRTMTAGQLRRARRHQSSTVSEGAGLSEEERSDG